ncbi:hypothetical protein ACFSM5_20600 [Lacibacterium aquatile]|uniref:VapC45 PIN like domain-containing protein n=1 Tax=Lacibacterium aquatile TaxID=1168082 RepID=A0ABW5DXZ6_9PROT
MKLLVAPSLPPILADALALLLAPEGIEVVHHSRRFPTDTSDQHWILTLSAEDAGWVVLTADPALIASPAGRLCWRQSGLIGLVLSPAYRNLRPAEIASRLLALWPRLKDWAAGAKGGQAAIVPSARIVRSLKIL